MSPISYLFKEPTRIATFAILLLGLLSGCAESPAENRFRPVEGDVEFVRDGEARAVVVIPDDSYSILDYAAEELVAHIAKATGVTLNVVKESDLPSGFDLGRIFIGGTRAAAKVGIDPNELNPDAFRLLADGRDFFIVGRDTRVGPVFNRTTRNNADPFLRGTLYGVYEVLERATGVLWLWPGDLGVFVPSADTVGIQGGLDETIEPTFAFRRFRTWYVDEVVNGTVVLDADRARLSFTPKGAETYSTATHAHLARHRVGFSERKPHVGHSFTGLWNRYGDRHPEFFMMREDGERGPAPGATERQRREVSLCVSNPDVHRFLVEEIWDGGDILRLSDVDDRVFCQCPDCKAWDRPVDQPDFARYEPLVSDRYARFWKKVHDLAVQRNPDVIVTTHLYWNYLPAPVSDDLRLEGVYGDYVPWGNRDITFYPMTDEAHAWNKEQWRGWNDRGLTLGYRPNFMLGGYIMPHLSTWQAGDMFQFAARNGMVGFDVSWLAHWGASAPMYYVHMRLAVDPERELADLRKEFFSGFGPAAGAVEKYFDFWEEYSRTDAPFGGLGWNNPTAANRMYPPSVFVRARALLDEAEKAASRDSRSEFVERVRFLKAGLEHARLAARFFGKLGRNGEVPTDDREQFEAARADLKELIEFRRAHEGMFISDLVAASMVETRRVDFNKLFEGDFDEIAAVASNGSSSGLQPWETWYFRKDAEDVGLAEGWYSPDTEATTKGLRVRVGWEPELRIDESIWTEVQVPAHLDATGIGDFLGYGWYATVFEVPENWRGQTVDIQFDGVDEQAWVFFNGTQVGEHSVESEGRPVSQLWDAPFSVEVPPHLVRAGRENLLVVRVHASRGSFGIWRPVSLRPADDLY